MDLERAEAIAEIRTAEASDGGRGIHDSEQPVGAQTRRDAIGLVRGTGGRGGAFEADAALGGPFFEVEEDAVEAEEHHAYCGCEEEEGGVAEGDGVEPGFEGEDGGGRRGRGLRRGDGGGG